MTKMTKQEFEKKLSILYDERNKYRRAFFDTHADMEDVVVKWLETNLDPQTVKQQLKELYKHYLETKMLLNDYDLKIKELIKEYNK